MKKISVAIATYNEEKNIERCLKSVVSWVDEIVVVDGSSQDKTVKIIKKYRAKVIISDNPPIFHINKQKAIDACTSSWIFQLDADEVVTKDLRDEIKKVIAIHPKTNTQNPINGYFIPRKNFFLGRFLMKGGQYPDYTMRLYRKGKGRLPCVSVHEQAEVDGNVGYLKNPLLHFPFPTFSHYLEHFNRYTTIYSNELKEKEIPINIFSFLNYFFIKPKVWFIKTYFRHKGFKDGFAGMVFSLFSSLRFPCGYIKYWEDNMINNKYEEKNQSRIS